MMKRKFATRDNELLTDFDAELTNSQSVFLSALFNEKLNNRIVLQGEPGTGKSFIIRRIAAFAELCDLEIALLGPTGMAATLIGGETIHHFFGIDFETHLRQEESQITRIARDNTIGFDFLVIDEYSTLSRELLSILINRISKTTLLILSGDPYQCEPREGRLLTDEVLVKEFNFTIHTLKESVRHSKDALFYQLLRCIRHNEKPSFVELLLFIRWLENPHVSETIQKSLVFDITLVVSNPEKTRINNESLRKLPGKVHTIRCYVRNLSSPLAHIDETLTQEICAKLRIPSEFEFKIGCVVILLRNLDSQWVNGTLAYVREYSTEFGSTEILLEKIDDPDNVRLIGTHLEQVYDYKIRYQVTFIPLELATSMTIFKSQGQTFRGNTLIDATKRDLDRYPRLKLVGLSRSTEENKWCSRKNLTSYENTRRALNGDYLDEEDIPDTYSREDILTYARENFLDSEAVKNWGLATTKSEITGYIVEEVKQEDVETMIIRNRTHDRIEESQDQYMLDEALFTVSNIEILKYLELDVTLPYSAEDFCFFKQLYYIQTKDDREILKNSIIDSGRHEESMEQQIASRDINGLKCITETSGLNDTFETNETNSRDINGLKCITETSGLNDTFEINETNKRSPSKHNVSSDDVSYEQSTRDDSTVHEINHPESSLSNDRIKAMRRNIPNNDVSKDFPYYSYTMKLNEQAQQERSNDNSQNNLVSETIDWNSPSKKVRY